MSNVEHRFKKRLAIKAIVYIAKDNCLSKVTTKNLSPFGALLRTNNLKHPPNIRLKICCTINHKFFEIAGITIHSDDRHTGVEFLSPQPEFYKALIQQAQQQQNPSTIPQALPAV